jgi:hypothetical protein
VAGDAILAQIILRCPGGVDDLQVSAPGLMLDRGVGFAGGHHLVLDRIECAAGLAVGTEELDHRFAAGYVEILDDRELLDLVEENFPLPYRAGDHHAGQSGHGHFVDALGEILGLPDGGVPIDLGGPDDDYRPDNNQNYPNRGRQPQPNLPVCYAHGPQPLGNRRRMLGQAVRSMWLIVPASPLSRKAIPVLRSDPRREALLP